MTRSGSPAQAPPVAGQCEPVTVFLVFSLDAVPALGTLCGSVCGSTSVLGFANNRSSCHSPSEAAGVPTAAAPGQWAHPSFSWLGTDAHNGSLEPFDRPVVRSIQIL